MEDFFDHISDELVVKTYESSKNYKIIENSSNKSEDSTIVYFSSNGLYFPNNKDVFTNEVIIKDKYEWIKISKSTKKFKKVIFIRDVFKQWYLKGINSSINNIDKLIEFISKENTNKKLILVGISSGGYISSLIGSKLNADIVLNFAGQLSLEEIYKNNKNKLVTKYYDDYKKYYNLQDIIEKSTCKIFYFVCNKSLSDKHHINIAINCKNIRIFSFECNLHGVPFRNILLPKIINITLTNLDEIYEVNKNIILNSKNFYKNFTNSFQYNLLLLTYYLYKVFRIIISKIGNRF